MMAGVLHSGHGLLSGLGLDVVAVLGGLGLAVGIAAWEMRYGRAQVKVKK